MAVETFRSIARSVNARGGLLEKKKPVMLVTIPAHTALFLLHPNPC